MNNNKGLGMAEIALILAILIVFVLVFRDNLVELIGYVYRELMEIQ